MRQEEFSAFSARFTSLHGFALVAFVWTGMVFIFLVPSSETSAAKILTGVLRKHKAHTLNVDIQPRLDLRLFSELRYLV